MPSELDVVELVAVDDEALKVAGETFEKCPQEATLKELLSQVATAVGFDTEPCDRCSFYIAHGACRYQITVSVPK